MDKNTVIKALDGVMDPELGKSLVELKMIENIKISDTSVSFDLILTTPACPLKNTMKEDAEKALKAVGATEVKINFGSKVQSHKTKASTASLINEKAFEGIKNIIPVYSTKGGVGKSTVAVNLALSLAATGAKVAILDLDVYGPSVPRMLNVMERPRSDGKKILPIDKVGVKIMSIGFLLADPTEPVVWRGPLTGGAVKQLFEDVLWEDVDYMVVDLPPGTGDILITVAQSVPVTGTVFVTTPQSVAVDDTVKGVKMFEKLNVPPLGVVINMSYFRCPKCGEKTEIFPTDGMDPLTKDLRLEVLGDLPLDPLLAQSGDAGTPVVVAYPESETAHVFEQLAGTVASRISMKQ